MVCGNSRHRPPPPSSSRLHSCQTSYQTLLSLSPLSWPSGAAERGREPLAAMLSLPVVSTSLVVQPSSTLLPTHTSAAYCLHWTETLIHDNTVLSANHKIITCTYVHNTHHYQFPLPGYNLKLQLPIYTCIIALKPGMEIYD